MLCGVPWHTSWARRVVASMSSDPATLVDSLASRAQRLCSLPSVAMRVIELTSNPQVDARALKECIENDPALTCKILRVVNSSLFGLSREVSDLNQALTLLGSKPLKLLVLGFSLPSGLFTGVSGEVLGRYWRRTLTKAVAARELSETIWRQSGDEPFIAGLLQDLGALVCIQELGLPYARFLEKVVALDRQLLPMEVEALGVDHTQLSAKILAQWGLPESLVSAVRWRPPDEPLPETAGALAQILQLAELLCQLVVDGHAAALAELRTLGQRHCRLSDAQLQQLVAQLEERVKGLADVLSLQLPAGLDYVDVLAQAQSLLADAATSAALDLLRGNSGQRTQLESVSGEVQELSRSLREAAHAVRRAPVRGPAAAETPVAAVPPEPPPEAPAEVEPETSHVASPRLPEFVNQAAGACRQSRCALSLLLLDVKHLERLRSSRGPAIADQAGRLVQSVCLRLGHPGMRMLRHGANGYALILPACDRRELVHAGNQLLDDLRRVAMATPEVFGPAFCAHAGGATVAVPPKNFFAGDLIESANRCLYASRISGGVMKSIEL